MRRSRCWRWLAFTILTCLIVACATPPQVSETTPAAIMVETTTPDATDTPPTPTFTPLPSATPTGEPSPTLTFTPTATSRPPFPPTLTPSDSFPIVAQLEDNRMIWPVVWSPDSTKIASGLEYGEQIAVWDIYSGETVMTLHDEDGKPLPDVYAIDWAINSDTGDILIAAGGRSEQIWIWDSETGELLYSLDMSIPTFILDIEFNSAGNMIAVAHASSEGIDAHVWDLRSGIPQLIRPPINLDISYDLVKAVAWLPDGATLAFSVGSQQDIILWNVVEDRAVLSTFKSPGLSLDWSSDGSLFAAAAVDAIRVWDADTTALLYEVPGTGIPDSNIEFSPDGTILAVAEYDAYVHLYDAGDGSRLHNLPLIRFTAPKIAWSLDGKMLAVTVGRTLIVWMVRP